MRTILGLALVVLAPGAAAQFAPGPTGVHLSFGADAAREVVVAWTGAPSSGGVRVEYGPTDAFGASVDASGTPLPGNPFVAYRARIDGLEPATTYHYRVVMDASASDAWTFETGPAGAAPFTFLAWADQGVGDAARDVSTAAAVSDAAFVLVAGDLSYADGLPFEWDAYFEMTEAFATRLPLMAVPGNHEREAGSGFAQYDARLAMPGAAGERWYAFRYANVLVLGLDSEHACVGGRAQDAAPGFLVTDRCDGGPEPAQAAFIAETLAAARADPSIVWIVAFHHLTLWSDGPHGSIDALRAAWGPLYDEHAVDLVIQGHDHMYARTHTLQGDGVAATGTTYVTAGTGGAGRYSFQSAAPPEWEAARDAEHHGFVAIDVRPDGLLGRFVATDGTTIDEWWITKDAKGRPVQAAPVPPAPEPDEGPEGEDTPLAPWLVPMTLGLVALRRRRQRE